jgi:hypothetical protein
MQNTEDNMFLLASLDFCCNHSLTSVFFSCVFISATTVLTSPSRGSRGSFIGYSSSGLPLYSFAGDALQRTSHSAIVIAKNGLKQILEDADSRKIFYFLCINLVSAVHLTMIMHCPSSLTVVHLQGTFCNHWGY